METKNREWHQAGTTDDEDDDGIGSLITIVVRLPVSGYSRVGEGGRAGSGEAPRFTGHFPAAAMQCLWLLVVWLSIYHSFSAAAAAAVALVHLRAAVPWTLQDVIDRHYTNLFQHMLISIRVLDKITLNVQVKIRIQQKHNCIFCNVLRLLIKCHAWHNQ